MPELYRVRLREAISEVERELRLRQTFYPERVRTGKMNRIDADRQIDRMEAAARMLTEYMRIKGADYEG